MSEIIRASTQYADMQGTISIDGWDGLSTIGIGGGVGKGYWPIGLDIDWESSAEGAYLDPIIYVLAVDEGILEGKSPPEAVAAYSRRHEEIPVFRFRTKLKTVDLLPHIKRLSIILQDRTSEDAQLVRAGPDVIYGGNVGD
jgi:hypothetical protein